MELICNESRCLPESIIYREAEGSIAVLNNTKDPIETAINIFSVAESKFRNYSGIFLHRLVKYHVF